MTGKLDYDERAAQRLLAIYLTPDVGAQRAEVVKVLHPGPGDRILDVGAGPGLLAETLADAVTETGKVFGVDISETLLAIAARGCEGRPQLAFRHADATRLPFDDLAFDAAVSTQVLEYVADVDAAIREAYRVLRRGGRLVVMDTDWDSMVWATPDPARTRAVLAAWAAHAAHPGLPRTLAGRLRKAGFVIERRAVLPLFDPEFDEHTYSNRVIDLIVDYVESTGALAPGEPAAWGETLRAAGRRGEWFFSLNRYLFVASRPLEG